LKLSSKNDGIQDAAIGVLYTGKVQSIGRTEFAQELWVRGKSFEPEVDEGSSMNRRLFMQSGKTGLFITTVLLLALVRVRAADTLPTALSDSAFWKMVSEFSEPDGYYQYTVITSNETAYQQILPELTRAIAPGGTYLGVGPEQNFTYIAALRPKIAFIIDIRRDMMLEHLLYKAIFELSADRADFVSKLFSIPRPTSVSRNTAVGLLFRAYATATADARLAEANLKTILTHLKLTRGFSLGADDERRIRAIYLTFLREGVVTFHSSIESPGYTQLMTATDNAGRNWSFLATEENYNRVRAMHQKNLIVPLVGDFGGPKTLRMTADYLRQHGAIVNVFYLSNVEDYVARVVREYSRNIASLPIDPSSLFIRLSLSQNGFRPWLSPISKFAPPQGIL
jgi:hypothetical protein